MEQNGNRLTEVWLGVGPQTANKVSMLLKFPGIWIKNQRMDLGNHSSPIWIRTSCHSGPFTPFGPSVREMFNDDTRSKA